MSHTNTPALPLVALCIGALVFAPLSVAQDKRPRSGDSTKAATAKAADPVAAFEAVVERYEAFFATPQVALVGSPGQPGHPASYVLKRYSGKAGAFDIRKTDSLVSPYVATLNMPLRRVEPDYNRNSACGDVKVTIAGMPVTAGWSTPALAVDNAGLEACSKDVSTVPLQFAFALQRNAWVLKTVTVPDWGGKHYEAISRILGLAAWDVPSDGVASIEGFNAKWQALVR